MPRAPFRCERERCRVSSRRRPKGRCRRLGGYGGARDDVEALLGAIRPECAGFQFVDQGLKFPQHNVIGHHLKGEDAHVPRFITQLTGSWRNTRDDRAAKARQRPARNSMGSRRCAFLDSAARRPHSSARSRHCSRVLGGMARRASFPFLTSGSTVASLGRRGPERIEPAIADLAATIPLPQHSKTCGWALPIRRGRR